MDDTLRLDYRGQAPVLIRRRLAVRVVAGPDEGRGCPVELDPVFVGTGPENQLVLSDPQVSRRHLLVERRETGCLVRDLQSTNGTFYRGARLQEATLGGGAEVRLGGSVLRLELGEERREPIAGREAFGALVGTSPVMQRLFGLLAALAPTDMTVLIQGETGTGKELVAEELHTQSPRREQPFVVVDCGSLPPGLIESELFGHERGAFSGAESARAGAFEAADGGTVFLDEVGELALDMQTRLLRVLDKHEVRRLGGNRTRPVNVRVLAATNRDLRREVKAGRFRQDLFFRLAVARVDLPALSERTEDIPLLARHFLLRLGGVDPDAVLTEEVVPALCKRRWPGNIRQLRNFIERVVAMADGAPLSEPSSMISAGGTSSGPAGAPGMEWLTRALPRGYLAQPYKAAKGAIIEHFDLLYLKRLIAEHGLNIARLSEAAGVDRVLVRRMLRKYDLLPGSR
jgi:DNA-binding NtrC family response regulator